MLKLNHLRALASALVLLAFTLLPARARADAADRGYVLKVPSNLTTEWIEQRKKYIDDMVGQFANSRAADNKGVFKLICDFNPGNQPSWSDDFYACAKLAHYLDTLAKEKNVRTVAFVHDEVTRHMVLPVLACSEIVMSNKANGPPDKQRMPGFGRVWVDAAKPMPQKPEREAYLDLAQGRFSKALIQKMFDFKLEVVKVRDVDKNGERYRDGSVQPLPPHELVPGLGRDAVAFYTFAQAKEFGLCQQTPINTIDEVLREYGLNRNANLQDLPDKWEPWRVVVSGSINASIKEATERHIQSALGKNANLLIVQLECHDGDAQAAIDLAKYLENLKSGTTPLRTIAYVTKSARDTAAFLAFACDEIVMDPEANLNFEDYWVKTLKQDAKREENLRDNLVEVARAQGYPEVIARGMLDRKLKIYEAAGVGGHQERRKFMSQEELDAELSKEKPEWSKRDLVKPVNRNEPDKYLALTAETAKTLRLIASDGVAPTEQDVYKLHGLEAKDVRLADNDFLDALGEFLRSTWVSVFLVGVGILCLVMELKMPGVSLPGVIAAICFVLFFWAHSQHSTMGVLALLLFVLGLVFIAVEVFLLPGFTFPGIAGVLLMVAGIGIAAYGHWPRTSDDWLGFGRTLSPFGLSLVVAVVGAFILARYLPSIPFANRLMLQPPGQAGADGEEAPPVDSVRAELAALLGAIGVAATPLRPAGKVQFGEQFVDVVAEGSFVQPGTRVQVIEIEGNRVVVKEV